MRILQFFILLTALFAFPVSAAFAQANQLPVVSAGPDRTVQAASGTVSLVASAYDMDGIITSYAWTKVSGGNAVIQFPSKARTILSGLTAGQYVFRMTVRDNTGAVATDDVKVSVLTPMNRGPQVTLGDDVTVTWPTNAVTIPSQASDPDGDALSYSWNKISGGAATLSGASSATLNVSGMVADTYVFRVKVSDPSGLFATDSITVTVKEGPNQPPTVDAGSDKAITLPTNSVALAAVASDPEGRTLTYAWNKVSGGAATLGGANTATLNLTNLVAGTYVFRITVTDDKGVFATDDVTVIVSPANQGPTVSAGADKTIKLPTNNVSLTATANDSDGTIASYAWTKVSGGAAILGGANTATLNLTNLVAGTYVFRITVTDDDGLTASDDVTVIVQPANAVPTVSGGADKTIILPTNNTSLTATANDSDGTIASYAWSKVSGGAASLSGTNAATLNVSGMVAGTYVFRVTVTDNDGGTASDDVTVTVQPANVAPTVSAGSDRTITLPTSSVSITATANDSDGTIASYAWSKVTGGSVSLSGASTATLNVSGLAAGTYVFRITVTDDDGATASDDVTVTVQSANVAPTVSAGSDRTITLPTNSVSLTATASDSDGTIASYAWTKVTGGSVSLSGASTATLNVSGLAAGTYVFRVTVTDDDGATASDDVTVTVNAPPNQVPTVSGGADRTMTLPTNSVSLTATASDSDGTIASYAWTKVSGGAATLSGANTATLSISGLVAGTYVFRITVTDNDGGTASDDVQVVVNASASTTPVVDAGADTTLKLPLGMFTMTGTATPPSGRSISSYAWSKVSGPSVDMTNTANAKFTLNNIMEGTYVFRLTAKDNTGVAGTDDITVTVQAPNRSYGVQVAVRRDTNRFSDPNYGYYEYLPPSYNDDTTRKYPLIIFLHGQGEAGNGTTDLVKVENAGGMAGIIKKGQLPAAAIDKFIVVSPQTWSYFTPAYIRDSFLPGILQRYRVDTTRIYLTGLSYGAFAVWDYGTSYGGSSSNPFAAMVPISGNGNTIDGCKFKDIPVWAFHGQADTNVSTDYTASTNPVNKINACSPNVPAKVTIYTNGTHSGNVWDATYNSTGMNSVISPSYAPFNQNIYDWMLQYSRP